LPANDLALLIRAARTAGQIAARFWQQAPRSWEKPGSQGPVTEADIAIDAMLHEMLSGARPDYGWLSEESRDAPARLSARRIFIVDPIDGTRAFMKGERAFAHSLAVVEDGVPHAAVVFLPMLGRLYAGARDAGATLNGTRIRATGRAALDGAAILIASSALRPQFWAGPVPRIDAHLRPSLAYRMCLVAEGRFDAMITIRDSWHWDSAAGALIVGEAGGVVSDRGGAPLKFNTASAVSAGLVAAPPALHAKILRRLA